MKSEPGKLTLKRLALSPYHQDGFRQQEITMLNELDIQDSNSNSNHDFYITNTSFDFTTISNEDFNHSTKLMIHPNSGYDNIPAAFVKNATYPIVLGNKIRARAVAEYTLSCLFHHMTKLKNQKDWKSFCKSNSFPKHIPKSPEKTCSKYWISWGDWLGTGTIANQKKKYRKFLLARKYSRGLKILTKDEWNKFCKSGNTPEDIPFSPNSVYKNKGWISWGDWLGTNKTGAKK